MPDPLDIARHAGAALLAMTLVWTAYLLACRLCASSSTALRLSAAWTGMAALQVVLFFLTGAVGRFAFLPLLGALASVALVTSWHGRADLVRLARQDFTTCRDTWRGLGAWRVAAALVALPPALRVARAMVSPPLAWDALTYHLPRAVEWVQHGSFAPLPGPDASAYYTYFPPYGDVYLAWALVATHTDAWLFAAGAWAWAGVWLGGFALARTLGAPVSAAAAAACAGASVPAVSSYVSASYVDNAALATLLVALTFTLRTAETRRGVDAVVAGIAAGLLLATKSSAMPVVAVVAAWALVATMVARAPSAARALAAAALSALVVAAPPFVEAFIDTGNPFYPLDVTIDGLLHLPGDAQLTAMMRSGTADPRDVIRSLFAWSPWSAGYDHLGLGPAGLLLPLLAAAGLSRRGRRGLPAPGLLALVALAIGLPLASGSVRALWAFWPAVTARFLAPIAVLSAALAARAPMGPALWALAALSAIAAVPRGIGPSEWTALGAAWPVAIVAVGLGSVAWRLARANRLAPSAFAGLALLVTVSAGVGPLRDANRVAVYEDAARGVAFDLHPLAGGAAAWPLWRALDTRVPTTMALAAGLTGPGHNWFRYPLYGARLQHTIRYVPVTRDGALRSYADPGLAEEACQACWVRRLDAARIDALVILPPLTFEATWARLQPDRFTEVPGLGSAAAFLVRAPREVVSDDGPRTRLSPPATTPADPRPPRGVPARTTR